VSHMSLYFCESGHPTVCESRASPTFVSIALLFVSYISLPTVSETYVNLFLWGTYHTTVWVTCRPNVCTSHDSLLLWVSIALLFVSHMSPPTLFGSCVIVFCESCIRLLFVSHVSP